MKGVYLAFFRLNKARRINIGALGEIHFEPGIYVYAGSAMNNVEKRLERHFNKNGNKHWHIDYFSTEAEHLDYLILPLESKFECWLSGKLSSFLNQVEGFGSSDCGCTSHLFYKDLNSVPELF